MAEAKISNVKAARRRRGLTQLNVARALGKSEVWVTRVETGRHGLSLQEAAELAALLGKKIEDLVMETSQ